MILHQSKTSTVTKVGNYVEKVFHESFPFEKNSMEWLQIYNNYCSFSEYPVRVHSISKDKIVMDYVDGIPLNAYLKTNNSMAEIVNLTSQIMDIFNDAFEFAKLTRTFTIHNDFGAGNILIRSDGSMVLIDPDSFTNENVIDFNGCTRTIQYMSSQYTQSLINNLTS